MQFLLNLGIVLVVFGGRLSLYAILILMIYINIYLFPILQRYTFCISVCNTYINDIYFLFPILQRHTQSICMDFCITTRQLNDVDVMLYHWSKRGLQWVTSREIYNLCLSNMNKLIYSQTCIKGSPVGERKVAIYNIS
jgi:hypothetical protein